LDINDNPNSATDVVVTPDLSLPAIIASTVYNQVYYYGYSTADFLVGYQVPGDGLSGFGAGYTYNFTSSFVPGAWTAVFDDLRNYQTIIRKSEAEPKYALFGDIAHILKAYNYQLLVDAYGDVPYTEGLQGASSGILSPKYDKDADVYKALVGELNDAIAAIKIHEEQIGGEVSGLNSSTDPVFAGDFTKWIQFANNIKLRLLIRARGTSIDGFVQEELGKFSSEGFYKDDVLVNPGYNAGSQQNPYWTAFHSSVDGTITQAARFYIASKYILTFYDGNKLSDDVRGALVYKEYPDVPAWQLADETGRPHTPEYLWHIGTGIGKTASDAKGILKSRAAAAPLFFGFETYFLLAEAALYGHALDGDAKTNFEKGIAASFNFLEKGGPASSLSAEDHPEQDARDYITANSGSYLANFDLATTVEQKLEAIITQKYIALNVLNANEAWNEFRRTSYPKISGSDPLTTFVSIRSQSPRADELPVRLIYPQAEYNLNVNTPKVADAYSSPVFWDKE
jgi:hypothetical protein